MAEFDRTQTVSRSAWLELKVEQLLVNDGYEFLDEKRILLAAEMLEQRDTFREARRDYMALCEHAATALVAAVAEQGLEGLQVHPASRLDQAQVHLERRPRIGQIMLTARFSAGETEPPGHAVLSSPAVRRCENAFGDLLSAAAALAALTTNLKRLAHEYRRTERRVRALENVVLPEIREDLAHMEEHLELVEQEEVIRVRMTRSERA